METDILTEEQLKFEMSKMLNKLLADEFLLFTKTLNAQWNVEKKGFHSVQMFFAIQFNQINGMMNRIAERIHFFGYYAVATLQQFLETAHLTETIVNKNDSDNYILELWGDHNCVIDYIKNNIEPLAKKCNDQRTCVFLTCLLEDHKKMILTLLALS